MSVNLLVWKWAPSFDSAPKRRRLGVRYEDVVQAYLESGTHPSMAPHEFRAFEEEVAAAVGPEVPGGLYILERSVSARVFNISLREAELLVPKIGLIARRHGLASAAR